MAKKWKIFEVFPQVMSMPSENIGKNLGMSRRVFKNVKKKYKDPKK